MSRRVLARLATVMCVPAWLLGFIMYPTVGCLNETEVRMQVATCMAVALAVRTERKSMAGPDSLITCMTCIYVI